MEHVAAGQREAPDRDPRRVHLGQRGGERDGGTVVVHLIIDPDDLARAAAALAEPAEVEGQDAEPRRLEVWREGVARGLLGHAGAASHDDARAVGAGIVQGGDHGVAAGKVDVVGC